MRLGMCLWERPFCSPQINAFHTCTDDKSIGLSLHKVQTLPSFYHRSLILQITEWSSAVPVVHFILANYIQIGLHYGESEIWTIRTSWQDSTRSSSHLESDYAQAKKSEPPLQHTLFKLLTFKYLRSLLKDAIVHHLRWQRLCCMLET